MSRVTVWILCCAIVTLAVFMKDRQAPGSVLAGFYWIIGAPLVMHWLFGPTQQPRHSKGGGTDE